MTRATWMLWTLTVSALLRSMSAPAAAAAPTQETLPPDETARIVAAVSDALRQRYVFPERADTIVARLRQAQLAGRYDRLDASALADSINADLRATSHDGHLYLRYDRARFAALAPTLRAGPAPVVQDDAAPNDVHPGDGVRAGLSVPQAPRVNADEAADERALARRDHQGVADLRLLPGNVRYLRITGFEWVEDATGAVYDDAMRFLRDGDAIVIDLRGNGGGAHPAVRYLVSHFLDPDVLLYTFVRRGGAPEQSRTLDHLPAGRIRDTPLYVLIDGGTASAAEDFAYQVRQFKLGTLVGERSAGAANNNEMFPVADGLILSLSVGRPVHPLSGGNWEGVGIAPDIATAPESALEVAQRTALDRLLSAPGLDTVRRDEYRWARLGVDARLRPVVVAPDRLSAWAGRYGDLELLMRDGGLWIARPARPTRRLRALSADGAFAVEGVDNLHVVIKDGTLELWRLGDAQTRIYAGQ